MDFLSTFHNERMAQCRQGGGGGNWARNGVVSDHVSVSIRGDSRHFHHRRSKPPPASKISIGFCALTLFIILSISALFYFSLQGEGGEINRHQSEDDDMSNDMDFLTDVTQIVKSKELKFGHGSVSHGQDSRYRDKDDRRRDEDYNEEELERAQDVSGGTVHTPVENRDKVSYYDRSHKLLNHRGNGLYNEAGRNELKTYEAEYEASLKSVGESTDLHENRNQQSGDTDGRQHRPLDDDDEYDNGIELWDDQLEEGDERDHSSATEPRIGETGDATRMQHAAC